VLIRQGVGICAINVAKWIGAEIYATVGSEEKASYLANEFGIPRDHIFNSRDSSFLEGVLNVTNGVGVDVVLNSLSGELLNASWNCVAADGAMIEIGKRDSKSKLMNSNSIEVLLTCRRTVLGRGKLALAPFEDNRTFLGGEATRFMVSHRSTVARLLNLVLEEYLKGNLSPIGPIKTFDAENVEEAFRYMQKGSHIGKIVIKFPQEDVLSLTSTVPAPKFRGDASYLLAGGLGGLGKAIAGWMASHGARNLMFLSRSAGRSEEDQDFFKELNKMGCSTQAFPADITDSVAVQKSISQATLPIAGAMQMAMVLADVGVLDMDLETWYTAIRPKIQGAWNLHNNLPTDLDFLVLFSSIGGMYGYYGQSNYASGNTFLDSFAQYRQNLGLAASVLSIGPIDEVGFVSRTPSTRETLLQSLSALLTEQNFLDTLQLAIARSSLKYSPKKLGSPISGFQAPSHIVHALESSIPIMDAQNGTMWKRDPRMSIYRNIQKASTVEGTSSGDQLKQFLSSMASDPGKLDQKSSSETIAIELKDCISNFLMKGEDGIELSSTLSALGVDSLVAIEVRNWWKQNLGIEVSVLELLSGGSIEQLGELATKRLKVKYASK
jgi:acyl carrier protein/NADP-dependent 3-hydroxy acid dehydrogenase YdfG